MTAFARVTKEMLDAQNPRLKMASEGLRALREVSEQFVVGIFEDANACCLHARRATLQQRDVRLAWRRLFFVLILPIKCRQFFFLHFPVVLPPFIFLSSPIDVEKTPLPQADLIVREGSVAVRVCHCSSSFVC